MRTSYCWFPLLFQRLRMFGRKNPNVRMRSGILSGCGCFGAPVHCGCSAGSHGCDPVSRVRLDQSANPVVVWLGLVSRVVRSSWSRGAFVH